MKIFINDKIRNISIMLAIIHCLALMYTQGGSWSTDPKDAGFWLAIFSAITSTIVINVLLSCLLIKKAKRKMVNDKSFTIFLLNINFPEPSLFFLI
jgi:hypothetical protein